MKRNLFAAFLAVMLVMALVFVVVPNAQAEDQNALTSVKLQESPKDPMAITKNTLLDLNGFNVTVNIDKDATLYVIDSGNNKKDGSTAGVLTKTGEGTLSLTAQDPTNLMRYVAIKDGETYTFHICNLTFSQIGLNTKAGENNEDVEICLRATYFGNDKVVTNITEFGVCPVVDGKPVQDPQQYYSANKAYNFAQGATTTHAFFNLVGSLSAVDNTSTFCAYMVIDGTTIYSSNFDITPREVLKKINTLNPTPSPAQKKAIETLMSSNTRVNNILSNLRPEIAENTLSFSTTDKRVSLTTEQQVWVANGVTFTNDKTTDSSNIIDSSNPIRLYKNSTITVAAAGMTQIVFNCNNDDYATALKTSIDTPDGVTVNADGKVVTVTFDSAKDTFNVTLSSDQVRLDSIVVTATPPSCTHEAHNAKCTVAGACLDCDEPVAATGHTKATDATCNAPAKCHCGEYMDDQIDENAHNYVDGTCTICGGKKPGAPTEPVTVTVSIADYAAANGWSNSTKYTTLEMDGYITVTAAGKDNTGKYYTSGNEWRTYQSENATVTVTAADGMTIVSVKITYNISNSGALKLNGTTIASKDEVAIDAASVTFNVGNSGTATNGQVKITAIEVTYMPACDHEGGTATCTEKKVCTKCGNPYGEPLGHTGGTATCNELAKCETCGDSYGSYATNHVEGTPATCQSGAICSVCKKPYGEPADHRYDENGHTCDYDGCDETTGDCTDGDTNGFCDYCEKEVGGTKWTEKTYSYTFTSKQYTSNAAKTLNSVSWTLAGCGNYYGYDATKGQQFGSSGAPSKNMTLTSGTKFDKVTKIVINTSGATSISGSVTVSVGGTVVKTITLTKTATEYTIDVNELSGAVVLSYTQTSSKAIYLKSISIDYSVEQK